MDKKDKLKTFGLICWFIVLPVITIFFKIPYDGICYINKNVPIIYKISIIFGIFVFLLLWIQSLIKFINYRNDNKKRLVYRRTLINYLIFLIIIFLGWWMIHWIGTHLTVLTIPGTEHYCNPPFFIDNNY